MFFLLVFLSLDLLKIAAWSNSHFYPWHQGCGGVKCDNMMSFKYPVQQLSAARRQSNADCPHYSDEPRALASNAELN